ncbi:MAG: tyrosine-type recombinase/integrase [Pseudolysinimonas sp.]
MRRAESIETYRELWGVLVKWAIGDERTPAEAPDLTVDAIDAAHLHRFLAARHGADGRHSDPSPRYVWRLLNLIDRVLAEHARIHGTEPSDAASRVLDSRHDWQYANDSRKNPLPQYLQAAEAKVLVNYLSSVRPRVGRGVDEHSWQELRDRASVAVQLGAGLTPVEIRALRLRDVVMQGPRERSLTWKILVKPQPLAPNDETGTSVERETPIAGWAAQVLAHWLEVRPRFVYAGDYAFPSTRTGKPWSKMAQNTAVREVLEASGIEKSLVPGGSFRLRHTFALRQLRRGHRSEEVARWLGIVQPEAMKRYERVLYAPVTVD